jgi:hypothetical protein
MFSFSQELALCRGSSYSILGSLILIIISGIIAYSAYKEKIKCNKIDDAQSKANCDEKYVDDLMISSAVLFFIATICLLIAIISSVIAGCFRLALLGLLLLVVMRG